MVTIALYYVIYLIDRPLKRTNQIISLVNKQTGTFKNNNIDNLPLINQRDSSTFIFAKLLYIEEIC